MTLFAIGFAIVLCKATSCKSIHAECTDKVLGMPLLAQCIHTFPSNWLPTTGAQRASLLMVMSFTVRFPTIFKETAACKGLLTVGASKMLRVPLLSQSIDAISPNWVVTTSTFGSKQRVEICLTIGSSVSLKEVAPSKGLKALCADEVVHVPLLSKSSDASIEHWLVTMGTLGAIQFLEASLTVGRAIRFEEIPCSKRFSAIATHKVLRMVGLAKSLNDFS